MRALPINVAFSQIYIEPGVRFGFTHLFQRRISAEVTGLVSPSAMFSTKYGSDWTLVFNVSAKKGIDETEIRGPAVFKRTKDIEYTIFLPFDVIHSDRSTHQVAMRFLLKASRSVFESIGIDSSAVTAKEDSMIAQICADSTMFERTAE